MGKEVDLDLPPGPGLTLVIGRNGSGKSSFAEALELLLTGETYRWLNRTRIWKDGWRNLHHPVATIQAEFSLQGESKPCALKLEWIAKAMGARVDLADKHAVLDAMDAQAR